MSNVLRPTLADKIRSRLRALERMGELHTIKCFEDYCIRKATSYVKKINSDKVNKAFNKCNKDRREPWYKACVASGNAAAAYNILKGGDWYDNYQTEYTLQLGVLNNLYLLDR